MASDRISPEAVRAQDTAPAREAALREILDIISKSRDDEQPVFDMIVARAAALCEAERVGLHILSEDGRQISFAAHHGSLHSTFVPGGFTYPVETDAPMAQAIRKSATEHVADLKDHPSYLAGNEGYRKLVEEEGFRTILAVPLAGSDGALGALALWRTVAEPFSTDEFDLAQGFAAQAVIAIENVRQFRELQERLEREKATSDVLSVISRSRDDELPVFQAIHESASRLCDAPFSGLFLVDESGENLDLVSHLGGNPEYIEASNVKWPLDVPAAVTNSVVDREIVHVHDVMETDAYRSGDAASLNAVELEGTRTFLAVPMLTANGAIGTIGLYRREVCPFTEEQISIVQMFAAQAVIAVENVRQFRALQARLEREAASAEILEVISTSRDDDKPVFEVILENAARLCNAPHAFLQLRSEDDSHLAVAAQNFAESAFLDGLRANPIPIHNNPGSISVLGMHGDEPTMYDDVSALKGTKLYTEQLGYAIDREGMRTALFVPLKSSARSIGVIVLYRLEVAPFSQDEIALVQTFAAQAVIAIENVRQFKALESLNAELGDRVEEQVGEIERMGRMKQFLSPAVAEAVVTSGDDGFLKSHRRLIATLFCDIRGFTAFCESAEPEETIEVLQTYHEELGALIDQHNGGVDKRMGDGIMVIFNDPLPCEDPAGDAVRLALAMREKMVELCNGWKRLGHRLGFGVGISLGYATVGMVGSEGRYDYTASGSAVNLAARLCDGAADGEILISQRAAIAVEDEFAIEPAGPMTFKGINQPVDVMRVVGPAGG
ncbi:MAG: GAF domain-containing protein [Pseudomonadota bacterium]